MKSPFCLFYHIVEDSIHNIKEGNSIAAVHRSGKIPLLKELVVRVSPNKGKDIGGKLVLMDSFLRLGSEADFVIFLHDKKSPHAVHNTAWQKKLFRIIDPDFAANALAAFEKDPKLGIVAADGSIQDEFDVIDKRFKGNNAAQISALREVYQITNSDHRHVAGTMFWSRALPLVNFFKVHAPLAIRASLEPGNVLDENNGTQTHAWERMLSWVVTEQGYHIKGLP